jgi:ubiquinone/menaquinone biosynthesis C-methylase UbiE
VAWCYDELAAAWSLGRIGAAKRWHLAQLAPGAHVLYAGAGRGAEALLALRQGARVTAIDCSPGMLGRFARSLAREPQQDAHRAELCLQDLFDHRGPPGGYDVVAAHFFLNVFDAAGMREALARIVSLVRPGGQLVIADFARPSGGPAARAFGHAYYGVVDLAGFALGLAALHAVHDYPAALRPLGFEIVERRAFGRLPGGAPLFEAMRTRSADGAGAGSA